MSLHLPDFNQLSSEELDIINLPLERTYVIEGGPGTGKTVCALQRAAQLKRANADSRIKFLVYNVPLKQYLKQAVLETQLDDASVDSYYKWFGKYYFATTGAYVPNINNKPYNTDWDAVTATLPEPEVMFEHLIIDEAQDFPKELLELLRKMSKTASVFLDDRQSLTNVAARKAQITNAFNVGQGGVFYLTKNFRNTGQISDLARVFYTGDPSDQPARSNRKGDIPRATMVSKTDDVIDIIATYADNHPEENIGVLLPDYYMSKSYYFQLKNKLSVAMIQLYEPGNGSANFDFEKAGVKVIAYNTVKGLEFDTVFLPEIDSDYAKDETILKLNNLYVCCTRAKNLLQFFYCNANVPSFIIKRLKAADNDQIQWDLTTL